MDEFAVDGRITLAARIAAGQLTVTAEPRDTATVSVTPADARDAARDAAEQTRVEFTGGVLTIESPRNGWRMRRTGRIRVDVRVPEDTALDVRLAAADARLSGRYGDATLHTASGDLAVDHVAGSLDMDTASGDVDVVRVDGHVRAKSASGNVRIGYAGGDVTAGTASGDLLVEHAEGSVRAHTASGDVQVGAARRGTVELTAASGDLRVGVVTGTRVWLDVSTTSGRVRSDLDHERPAGSADTTAALTVRARTLSGDVELRRVPAEVPA